MTDDAILERIRTWRAEGLIDVDTATRLLAAETASGSAPGRESDRAGFAGAGAIFGPGIAVGEMFAYLGGAFLLAAWYALIARLASGGGAATSTTMAAGALGGAIVAAGIGIALRGRSPRLGRAAGVALVAASVQLAGAGWWIGDAVGGPGSTLRYVLVAVLSLGSATLFRRLHPTMLTQLGLVVAVVTTAWAAMAALEPVLFPPPAIQPAPTPDSVLRPVLIAVGWGIAAVGLGVLALREARSGTGPSARRAGLTRFAAGMTAVLGTATAVFASGVRSVGADGFGIYGRLLEPVIGDAILIVVSAVLLERAFRREASAFVYPAALGVIIGLTDANGSYVASATSAEFALLVEGAILLAAGFAFDRFRRRVGARGTEPLTVAAAAGG